MFQLTSELNQLFKLLRSIPDLKETLNIFIDRSSFSEQGNPNTGIVVYIFNSMPDLWL